MHHILQEYVDLRPHEYVAVALWVLHTHIYDRFLVSPRLTFVSPVRGCGKTTLLAVIERLLWRGHRTDNISPAAIYRLVDQEHCTLLVDEADNLGLTSNGPLRAVLNSGHRKGGWTMRVVKDRPRKFSTFAPMAIAAIGNLPLPIIHRSIVIPMQRSDGMRKLRRLDEGDPALSAICQQVRLWVAGNPAINLNPEMPPQLRNRLADNWRPLIGIADAFGPYWGAAAREAAVALTRGHNEEDFAVTLLRDIRDTFDAKRVDRLFSATIVAALNAMEDAPWSEWRGLHDDQRPRPLSQAELAGLLAPFRIRPRTIWPLRRNRGSKSAKGYLRSQFEAAWRSYCDLDDTAAQPKDVKYLRRL